MTPEIEGAVDRLVDAVDYRYDGQTANTRYELELGMGSIGKAVADIYEAVKAGEHRERELDEWRYMTGAMSPQEAAEFEFVSTHGHPSSEPCAGERTNPWM